MSRTRTYADIRSDGRDTSVSIGGRGRNDWITAWFNADTASGEADATFKVESSGERRYNDLAPRKTCQHCGHVWAQPNWASANEKCPDCGRTRQGACNVQAHFTLTLPANNPDVTIKIQESGAEMKKLAAWGASLVSLKGMMQLADPDPSVIKNGEYLLEQAAEILESLKLTMDEVPANVIIMGHNLRHLLACERMVAAMLEEQEKRKDSNQN